MSDANVKTVQGIYEAFGRGDVPAILDRLTDDVDWSAESELSLAPWHGRKLGKAQVPSFFVGIASALDVNELTPLSFAANDTDVMVVLRFDWTSKATGKQGTMNIHHWWQFRDGKVSCYRGSEDTALMAATLGS
jgi:ketosteroid isomerase-like protein